MIYFVRQVRESAGCVRTMNVREGMKESGSALTVGQHTTASVVHSIFVVILIDALAALFFMRMGW